MNHGLPDNEDQLLYGEFPNPQGEQGNTCQTSSPASAIQSAIIEIDPKSPIGPSLGNEDMCRTVPARRRKGVGVTHDLQYSAQTTNDVNP